MRKSVPDDVHLALRISELLHSLTTSLLSKLVRLHVNGKRAGASKAAAAAASTVPSHAMSDFYKQSGIDPPPVVDLEDPNVTIMPPSDFFNPRPDAPLSPIDPMYSPSAGAFADAAARPPADAHQRNLSSSTGSTDLRNTQQTMGQSPASTAGGYEWVTLDLQRFLADAAADPGVAFDGGPAASPAGPTAARLAAASSPLASDHPLTDYRATLPGNGMPGGGMPGGPTPGFGGGGGGGGPPVPGTPFTGGAFGPEIAENAAFLAGLSGWLYDGTPIPNPGGSGVGGSGHAPIGGRGGPWNGAGNGHPGAAMTD